MRNLIAVALGVMFAIGLGVSGMTDPAVVLGFLDFAGNWNPTLLFVMAAAVPIYLLAWFGRRARGAILDASAFPAPRHDLDWQLFLGASLFGIGWGLAGICPGPAVTILAGTSSGAVVFVLSLLTGMFIFRLGEVKS